MNTENDLDKYVSRRVRIIATTVSIASAVYFFALRPIQLLEGEVSSIKGNHLVHIQASLDRIEKDIDEEQADDKKRDELLTRLEVMLTNHDNRFFQK